MIGIAMQSKVP